MREQSNVTDVFLFFLASGIVWTPCRISLCDVMQAVTDSLDAPAWAARWRNQRDPPPPPRPCYPPPTPPSNASSLAPTAAQFRSQLVEFERSYNAMGGKVAELESALSQEKAARQRLESRVRTTDRKGDEAARRLKELEKENQMLTLKV